MFSNSSESTPLNLTANSTANYTQHQHSPLTHAPVNYHHRQVSHPNPADRLHSCTGPFNPRIQSQSDFSLSTVQQSACPVHQPIHSSAVVIYTIETQNQMHQLKEDQIDKSKIHQLVDDHFYKSLPHPPSSPGSEFIRNLGNPSAAA